MAFTSKVVGLVFLSILAWCQVSSAGLVSGLDDTIITVVTAQNLLGKVSPDADIFETGAVVEATVGSVTTTLASITYGGQSKASTNALRSNDDPKQVSEALNKFVKALVEFLGLVSDIHKTKKFSPIFGGIKNSLEKLKTAIDGTPAVTSLDTSASANSLVGALRGAGLVALTPIVTPAITVLVKITILF